MKNLFLSLLIVLLLTSATQSQTSIAQHPEVAGTIKLLEAWIETQMAYRGQPGISESSFADAPVITIRHLLTHTSGLPREAAFPYWMDANFPTIKQVKETLPQQEAAFAPETRWKYSNLALALAGEIVAVVSGSPYDVYVRNHILEPLGMSSSTMLFPESHRSRLAVGYGRRMPEGKREIRPYMDCKGITPAANLSSTVEDLARYLAFEMSDGKVNGKTVLKSSTLRERHRVHWLIPDWWSGAVGEIVTFEVGARGMPCYGIGPMVDTEDGPKGFGAHSDQERILEESLHKFVRFHWDIVKNLALAR